MPSVWSQVQGTTAEDFSALDEAARQPIGPWQESVPLPLPEVEWAQKVGLGELSQNQQWPPVRFQPRQERLETYHELWRGDLRRLIDTRQLSVNSVAALNIPRRISKFVADLLVREVPTVGDEEGPAADTELMRVVHTAAVMAVKNGAAFLLFANTSAGPQMRALDSRWVYPAYDGGWVIVEPRNLLNAQAGMTVPDALQVTTVDTDGNANLFIVAGVPTGIGMNVTVGPIQSGTELGATIIAPVLALPEIAEGVWGTSWFDDLITTVVQKARLLANMTRVLDGNSDPLLLMRGNLDNYTSVPGVPRSAAVAGVDADPQRDAMTARRLRRLGPLLAPSGVEDASYITWDGSLEPGLGVLAAVNSDFRMISGMPAVLEATETPASGMSLRRQFWQFDAGIAPLFYGLKGALTRGLQFLGLGDLEWQNTFEVVSEMPEMQSREDVADEGSARRGEGGTDDAQ